MNQSLNNNKCVMSHDPLASVMTGQSAVACRGGCGWYDGPGHPTIQFCKRKLRL